MEFNANPVRIAASGARRNHLCHAIHLCFRVVKVRAEAQKRLSSAVVAQGRRDALLVEVLGDFFQ
jgi:hypothetical protein